MIIKKTIAIFAFLPLTLFSQSIDTTNNRGFFIGLNFSPDYCYRKLIQNDKTTSEQWNIIKNFEDSVEIPKFGYTLGLAFGYQINKKISLETGINYSNQGYKTVSVKTIYDFNKPSEKAKHITNFCYLDIPLKANITFLEKKLQLLLGIGATLNILMRTSQKVIPDNPTTEFSIKTTYPKYEYKKVNLSPTFNVGLKYNINDRFSLRTEPTIRYSLLNIDDKSYKSTHFWSAGLNIGLQIKI